MNERRRQSELFTAKHEAGRKPVPSDVPTTPQDAPKLKEIRNELQDIIKKGTDVLGHEEFTRIYSEEQKGGEIGLLQDKEVKRKKTKTKKEFKDKGLDKAEEMLVVLNDMQFDQADEEALGAALRFIKKNRKQITHLVLNGDIIDLQAASKFPKEPDEIGHTKDELDKANWLLQTLTDLLPEAKRVFIMGNHEDRYKNFIKNQTSGIEEFLISLEDRLGLNELGWETLDYARGKFWEWHDVTFWHGSRAGAKSNIPKLELEDTGGISVVTGHINRNMFHESVDIKGKRKFGMALGGFSKDDLRFVRKANSAWSQGFGVFYYDKKVGVQAFMVTMEHHNPRFIFNGEIFDGTNFQAGDKI